MLSDNHNELKMSLKELRDSIKLNKRFWRHILTTNCYAYALGLDIKEKNIKDYAYIIGTLSDSKEFLFHCSILKYSVLLENLINDFEYLGLDFQEIDPLKEACQEEWKIALFTSVVGYDMDDELIDDYHFLRQKDNGLWYHKKGWNWNSIPTNKDINHRLITNPLECNLGAYNYKKCYSLKLKK